MNRIKHCKTLLINVIKDFKHHRRATKHSKILLGDKLLSKYKQQRGFREIYACKAQLWNSLTVQRSFCLSKNKTFSEGGSDILFLKVDMQVIIFRSELYEKAVCAQFRSELYAKGALCGSTEHA